MNELKKRVVSGFIWTAGEKFGSTAIRLATSLVLMNLIDVDQYGLLATLAPFYLVGTTLADGGFDQALIQRKKVTETDYNSVFYLNLVLSVIFFIVLLGFSGLIGRFFDEPLISKLAPWLFAITPISSLGMVQMTRLNREMRFDMLSKVHLTATIVSSAVALLMAFTGWDIWSLVGQLLSLHLVRVIMVWVMSSWRPKKEFSMQSIKSLFSYGSNILFTNIIIRFFGNISQPIISKISNFTQAGFYNNALKLKEETSNTIQLSIVSVTFPAFSELQNEDDKLKFASRKVIAVISLVLFPAMAGLILVSPEVFSLLIPHWMPSVPYFRIFCTTAFFMPLTYVCLNIIRAKGASRMVLVLEIIKKTFSLGVIAYTATIGVEAMAVGYVIWSAFEMVVNITGSHRFIRYSLKEIFADTLPYLLITAVMFATISGVEHIWPGMTIGVKLAVKVMVGIAVYAGLNALIRPQAWKDAIQIAGALIHRKK